MRLRPLFGLRPGAWLAALYSAALLAALFFALFLPGLRNPGARVVFSSEPSGAALRIDGAHAGTSPSGFFVPAGRRSMEASLPGFEPLSFERDVPRRAFASGLFPRRYRVFAELRAADPAAALALSAAEHAEWSFGGEASARWQVPRSLSEGVYRIGAAAAGECAAGIIAASARFASTRAALRDLARAKALADSGGSSPSPMGLARTVREIAAFLDGSPASALWLAGVLPADSASALAASGWHASQLAAGAAAPASQSLAPNPAGPPPAGLPLAQVRVGGLLFSGIGGGALAKGEPFARLVPVEPFFASAEQVPPSVFAGFLDANPKWRRDNLGELARLGLATEDYLADFGIFSPGGGWSGSGVGAVSWHAARAFCEWLTSMLPPELDGWEARLPTEAEWEFAAKSAREWAGAEIGGAFAGSGGSWEWCAEPYAPLPIFCAPQWAIDAVGSPERPVRGGSWLNAAGVTGAETRAFLPPASASPFVSFRPVIARKSAERSDRAACGAAGAGGAAGAAETLGAAAPGR